MNSLYTTGVRQTSALQADLERLRNGDKSASLLGQISASLSAMHRTIEDYESMTRREMIKSKQEKGQMRVLKFRADYIAFRAQLEASKAEAATEKADAERNELLSTSATPSSADARRRFHAAQSGQSTLHHELKPQTVDHSESPFRGSMPLPGSRAFRALDEHTFLQETESRIDDFLAQGREVLENLKDQRQLLKGTQKRLLDAANTLGLSRNVIGWIEKRSTQDMYIFLGGAIFTFFSFFMIWHYLG